MTTIKEKQMIFFIFLFYYLDKLEQRNIKVYAYKVRTQAYC